MIIKQDKIYMSICLDYQARQNLQITKHMVIKIVDMMKKRRSKGTSET